MSQEPAGGGGLPSPEDCRPAKQKRFGFALSQQSVGALAAEVRKLGIIGGTAAGLYTVSAGPFVSGVIAFGVWLVVQLGAIAIEAVRVYPLKKDSQGEGGKQ